MASAILHVANSSAYFFTDALNNDAVLGTTVAGQRILVGAATSGTLSALSVTSNVVTVNRSLGFSNATGSNGLYSFGSNLGIGTATPSNALDVVGNIAVTGCALQQGIPIFFVKTGNNALTTTYALITWSVSPTYNRGFTYTGNNTITVITPGVYNVHARFNIGAAAAIGYVGISLYKNGVNFAVTFAGTSSGGTFNESMINQIVSCVAGDTLQIWGVSGASYTIDGATDGRSAWTITFVG
jgi:hypothetical protein